MISWSQHVISITVDFVMTKNLTGRCVVDNTTKPIVIASQFSQHTVITVKHFSVCSIRRHYNLLFVFPKLSDLMKLLSAINSLRNYRLFDRSLIAGPESKMIFQRYSIDVTCILNGQITKVFQQYLSCNIIVDLDKLAGTVYFYGRCMEDLIDMEGRRTDCSFVIKNSCAFYYRHPFITS